MEERFQNLFWGALRTKLPDFPSRGEKDWCSNEAFFPVGPTILGPNPYLRETPMKKI